MSVFQFPVEIPKPPPHIHRCVVHVHGLMQPLAVVTSYRDVMNAIAEAREGANPEDCPLWECIMSVASSEGDPTPVSGAFHPLMVQAVYEVEPPELAARGGEVA